MSEVLQKSQSASTALKTGPSRMFTQKDNKKAS